MINCKFNDISFWKWKKITWWKIAYMRMWSAIGLSMLKISSRQSVRTVIAPLPILTPSFHVPSKLKMNQNSILCLSSSILYTLLLHSIHFYSFYLSIYTNTYFHLLISYTCKLALRFNWRKPRTDYYFIIFSSSDPMAVAPAVDAEYLKEIELTRADLRSVISSMNIAPLMLRLAYVLSDLLSKIRSWAASQSAFELEIWNLKSKKKI